ncbi:bifunctional methylenetetrahydrofolate dehydrogenase/methenyltetrahydrofolate cyclohydrolase FolD [Oleisolibacter albus]|uniref:bifunctional methylenetetrahydrofolate dehydrogenase/methenyltetrahydrofolate cyclohydrolase FolD n=1 Tax=Oleisolibacter albus TaxID=2171757 RepID=UPI000DF4805E|nr:bifunctional methylenetetrahydrofolate dehydrogenase/methenyltetrahydrofolate cyclohydrolase FolD [Oleisolibacter albus]
MSEARIIDGKAFAADLRGRIGQAVQRLRTERALIPGLAVVLVGEDPASQIYVRNKGEQTRESGMHSVTHRLPADTTQEALLRLVDQLNHDPSIHGILVQLPLPAHIDSAAVLAGITPEKDVDGFHVVNAGRLAVGLPALVPCTPLGCLMLLRDTVGSLRGLHAVVVGRSNIVGKPMAQLLLQQDCTVTVAHSRTVDLPAVCRGADILVAAVGRPEMVRGDWIKEGAVVIDVGINRVPARDPVAAAAGKTRLVGDVAFEEAKAVAGAITPVPGGVGPMTIACLLLNTLTAACRTAGIDLPAEVTTARGTPV